MPRVGSSRMTTSGSVSMSLASTSFCWLPPDRAPAATSWRATRTSNSCDRGLERARSARSSTNGRAKRSSDCSVTFSRRLLSSSSPLPLRSSVRYATRSNLASSAWRQCTGRPSLRTRPRSGRSPRTPSNSSVRPAPTSPARPSTSPRRTCNVTPSAKPGHGDVLERERDGGVGGHGALGRVHVGQLAAHHAPRHVGGGEVGGVEGADLDPVAEDGDPVGDRLDLVELVRHVEHRDAVGHQAPDELEQDFGLGAGEHVGGLVHAQDADLARHRLGDLDHLHLRHRQVAHAPRDRDLGPQGVEQGAGAGASRRAIDEAEAVPLAPQRDVLLDREVGDQVQLLVDQDDAGGLGGVGVREADRRAAPADLAAGRREVSGEQLHQRRLAGAVLAQERVHLAGADVDVDRVQDLDGAEGLAEATAFQDGWVRQRAPPSGGPGNAARRRARSSNECRIKC